MEYFFTLSFLVNNKYIYKYMTGIKFIKEEPIKVLKLSKQS